MLCRRRKPVKALAAEEDLEEAAGAGAVAGLEAVSGARYRSQAMGTRAAARNNALREKLIDDTPGLDSQLLLIRFPPRDVSMAKRRGRLRELRANLTRPS